MEAWLFLVALLAVASFMGLRTLQARHRRQLREARRRRRAEEARRWEQATSQLPGDDWRP